LLQSGTSSLQIAVKKGHVDTVRALLEHKAHAAEPKVRF
jgi:ankyrin repeat protein